MYSPIYKGFDDTMSLFLIISSIDLFLLSIIFGHLYSRFSKITKNVGFNASIKITWIEWFVLPEYLE